MYVSAPYCAVLHQDKRRAPAKSNFEFVPSFHDQDFLGIQKFFSLSSRRRGAVLRNTLKVARNEK
jgi:ABC-type polysaccharide transport system permease subunit